MLPIEHWITTTQTPIYFVRTPALPILELRLVFDAGSAHDGNYPGIAELTHNLLSEGTAELDAEAVANRFENVGAIFQTSNDSDKAVISLRTLTHDNFLKPSLDTLKAILHAPLFSPAGFAHQQKLLLSFFEHEEQSPAALIENAFFKALYPNHPYGTPSTGTSAGILALTPEQIVAFYRQHYVAQNASIAIVGNFSRSEANQLAEEIVEILPQGKRVAPLNVAPKNPAAQIKIPYVSAQTHIIMGQVATQFSDPFYFSLYVGNAILGGDTLISRLGRSIREEKGLVYDIRSQFSPLRYRGPFSISLQTRTQKAEQALHEVHKNLRAFIAKPPLIAELQSVQDNIVKGHGLHFDSNKSIASHLVMLAFYQLPLDYFVHFTKNILEVTPEQIHEAFKARIQVAEMLTICLGQI